MPIAAFFSRPVAAAALGLIAAGLLGAGPVTAGGDAPGRDPALKRRLGAGPRGEAPALFGTELQLPDTLGVGRVSSDVAGQLPVLETLAAALDGRAASLGYARVLPVIARDRHEMTDFLARGLVDVVSEEPLEAMHHVEQLGAGILLEERRAGRTSIRTVVFVREDAPLRDLADLQGECLALAGGPSGAEFLMPLAALRDAGLRFWRIDQTLGEEHRNDGVYLVIPPDSSVLRAVARRVAAAGAVSDEQWEREQADGNTRGLRVLHTFAGLPRAFLVAAAGVGSERSRALRNAVLDLQDGAEGRNLLAPFGSFSIPDPRDPEAEAARDRALRLYSNVREEVR